MKKNDTAHTYHGVKNAFFFVNLVFDIALLLIFFLSGLSSVLKQFSFQFSSSVFLGNGIYFLIFAIGMYILHFPLHFFIDFVWEHKFQLSTQKFSQWFADDMKKSLITFIVLLLIVEVAYLLLDRAAGSWWIWAGFFWLLITFFLAKITPHVIIPLFYKYSEIENKELKERIFGLFETCRVSLKNVYAIDMSSKTKKANAFFCGIGKGRRVVLGDTLLENFSTPEIEVVVAHELGHHKHWDILKLLCVNAMTIFLGLFLVDKVLQYSLVRFGLERIDDVAFFPMIVLALMMFGLLSMPLINGYSRRIERQADQFSIQLTQKPDDFISTMRKLGEMNLSEFQPNRFIEFLFYDHPPLDQRIRWAQSIKSSKKE